MHSVVVHHKEDGFLVYENTHDTFRQAVIDYELHLELMSNDGFEVKLISF